MSGEKSLLDYWPRDCKLTVLVIMATEKQYHKIARTRYLNLCNKELSKAKDFLQAVRNHNKGGPSQCREFIKKLTTFSSKLEQAHLKLLNAKTETEGGQPETEEDDLPHELVLDAIAGAMEIVSELESVEVLLETKAPPSEVKSSSTAALEQGLEALVKQLSVNHKATTSASKPSVTLPKLDLPVFDGSSSTWSEFWDTFKATIHDQQSISDVEKFHYLKSKLSGEALNVLSGIAVTALNYTVALATLEERYGNKQAEIDRHYISLMEMPQSSTATENLRATYDEIVKHLRSLKAFGQDVNQAIFVSLIMSKLPGNVQLQIELQKGDRTHWGVDDLLAEFHKWLSAKEQIRHNSKPVKARPTLTETFSATEPRSFRPKCFFCAKEHWSDECPTYDTLEKRKEKAKGVCYNCFNSSHRVKDCRSPRQCYFCKQTRNHHRSLCPKRFGQTSRKPEVGALAANCETVLMQSAYTEVVNPGDLSMCTKARILLDCGSHRTYVTESVAKKLNLGLGSVETLSVVTFGASEPRPIRSRVTSIGLKTTDDAVLKLSANVVPRISCTINRCAIDPSVYPSWNSLSELKLADTLPFTEESHSPDILIGSDFYLDIVDSERRVVAPGLYALNSKFGWIITGRVQKPDPLRAPTQTSTMFVQHGTSVVCASGLADAKLTDLPESFRTNLDDLWRLETIGISDSPYVSDDLQAENIFKSTVRFENGRYAVTWPWKGNIHLPTNYGLAYGRLRSLFGRLQTQPDLLQQYNAVIREQLRNGIIETVPDTTVRPDRCHYVPHHPVVTPGKETTKLRIVYDASAKSSPSNSSLNQCMYRGPVNLQNLCGMLLRFRINRIALLADIEKAFLQVALQEQDRDVTRFLWLREPLKPPSKENTIMLRFCRVPFGVISSPFLLAATIKHHLSSSRSQYADLILRDIYVDNIVTGVNSLKEAKSFYRAAKSLFRGAHMNLREWFSNSPDFDGFVEDLDKPRKDAVKVLGVVWDRRTDGLTINEPDLRFIRECVSKRQVMQAVGMLYDPVGWFSPTVLQAKCLLQKLWSTNLSWDSELSDHEKTQWRDLAKDLQGISQIVIPRYVHHSVDSDCFLACFCDASKLAYGTAVYLVSHHESHLLFSKTRVAPRKQLSIPRLELLAVVIGTRAIQYVGKELHIPITAKYVWTDSLCVLRWLASSRNLTTFVANRVKELRSHNDLTFRYVRTQDNPADIASRGSTTSELRNSQLWWHGPRWLLDPTEQWPDEREQITPDTLRDIESEYKQQVLFETSLAALEFIPQPLGIDHKDYSNLWRLLRVTAFCLQFISACRGQANVFTSNDHWLNKASSRWILYVQHMYYRDVNADTIKHLGVKCDELGILRCHGRLQNADLPYGTKFPILLPPKDHFTALVILDCHRKLFHVGVSHTLSQVRHTYWIPQGRATVRRILKTCVTCRKHETGPYAMPPMAPLPQFRLQRSDPFTYTGLDCLGPLYIKDRATDRTKVWLCLFTCLSTRAILLEVIVDMTAAQFLLCLRRFIALRGRPLQIISDNAPQFKLVNKVIDKAWNNVTAHESVIDYVAKEKIDWRYIPEFSPWMGGYYERMVGMVKRCLRKSLGKLALTLMQLQTIVKEIEAVVNTRPLTYVDDDVNHITTLTPAHLLGMSSNVGVPELDTEDGDVDYGRLTSREALIARWKTSQSHLNQFWKLWQEEYLLSLRETHRIKLKQPRITSHLAPTVNSVVIIRDNANVNSRGSWKLGRITKVFESADGQQRSAKVQLSSGKLITRPLTMLYPLECGEMSSLIDSTNDASVVTTQNTKRTEADRPTRRAKTSAEEKIKELSADGLV